MARPVYEFVRPSDGAVLKWSPLSWGQYRTVTAQTQGDNQHLRASYLILERLKGDDGKSYSLSALDQWEEDDVHAFNAETITVEAARAASFAKADAKGVAAVERQIADLRAMMVKVDGALSATLAAMKVAGPL